VRFFGDRVAVVYGSEHAVGKEKSQPNAKVCQIDAGYRSMRERAWIAVEYEEEHAPGSIGCSQRVAYFAGILGT
jgi:hypothetical protein